MIDFSSLLSNTLVQWAALLIGLLLIFIVLRYFLHVVVHILHFILNFFWHGCFAVIVILLLLYILHAFKLI
jgi:hypothetical protein